MNGMDLMDGGAGELMDTMDLMDRTDKMDEWADERGRGHTGVTQQRSFNALSNPLRERESWSVGGGVRERYHRRGPVAKWQTQGT